MATNSTRWRAVFDTNCIVAALKSPNPTSPNAELVRRWSDGEFDLLYTEQIRAEYVEKFTARSIAKQIIVRPLQFLYLVRGDTPPAQFH